MNIKELGSCNEITRSQWPIGTRRSFPKGFQNNASFRLKLGITSAELDPMSSPSGVSFGSEKYCIEPA
ncbi:hypothetical protein AUC45_12080 [Erythrobacter sp. YT30]|nr:hypothetical protein AUC45_12080 [Erythrobacter sp. YT30]